MKQFQFPFEDVTKFHKDLFAVRKLVASYENPKILFKIYSNILLTDFIEEVVNCINDYFPDAYVAGCTTNSIIIDGFLSNKNMGVQCIIFEDSDTKIDVVPISIDEARSNDLANTIKDIRKKRPWAKAAEMLVSMATFSYESFSKAFSNIKTDSFIFGGGAYNRDMISDEAYVFTKDHVYTKNAIIVIIYGGNNLFVKTTKTAGWKPLGKTYSITKAKDNVLYEIDNKPAFEIYSKYLNVKNNIFFNANSMEFPFLCSSEDGTEILRTPVSANEDNSILMFSKIDNFKNLTLTYGYPETILCSVREGAKEIVDFRPEVINCYSCVARKAFWKEDIDKEASIYQKIAPTFGFFTSGELLSENGVIHHHNETLVVVAMREGEPSKDFYVDDDFLKDDGGELPLINRLVNFIKVSTQEMEEAKMEADKANKAKSEFLANMSHEIRTPINAVLGLDTMILRSDADESIKAYAKDIYDAGQNLLTIINDILDLSKIESGNMELVPAEYKLASVITDVNNMVSIKALDKGLNFVLDIDPDLPTGLYGDDIRIKQVIVNLVNNAVKYTEQGSVTLKISQIYRIGKKVKLKISVIDTGIGIKEEDLANLFVKFKRIEESRNRSVEGTGLGMNIAIQFLKLMDSQLSVESIYGQGSDFSFEIEQEIIDEAPLGDFAKLSEDKKVEYAYNQSFEAPDANVLVVDDNSLNRKVILSLLKETRINLDAAEGGYECIEMTKNKKYDLILLDHMMPDLDGVQTLKIIREDNENPNKDIPIVALTANALTGAKEEYMKLGFDGFYF